jgi:hypothetical protein
LPKAAGAGLLTRGLAGVAMATAAALPAPAAAAEPGEEAPDAAFLEYLGSWEEKDSDWIALARTAPEEAERRAAPAEREQDEESRTDEETG